MAKRIFRRIIFYLFVFVSLCLLFTIYTQFSKVQSLPSLVKSNLSTHGGSYVPLSQMPSTLQMALIDTEDQSFYTNPGISFKGIGRSIITDLRSGTFEEGASTLTQQLVREHYLSPVKTISRKSRETILALVVTKNFSKQDVLEMYLNSVYFGHGAWGIQAAARTYFNKTTADLNPAECTLLAGLPKEPSYLDPLKNYQAARDRQLQVLQSMVNTGDMSQNEVLKIRGMPLGLKRKSD